MAKLGNSLKQLTFVGVFGIASFLFANSPANAVGHFCSNGLVSGSAMQPTFINKVTFTTTESLSILGFHLAMVGDNGAWGYSQPNEFPIGFVGGSRQQYIEDEFQGGPMAFRGIAGSAWYIFGAGIEEYMHPDCYEFGNYYPI